MIPRQALEELHDDVPDRGVTDDDVGGMVWQVPALDVPDEAQGAGAQQGRRLLDALLALASLLPDREERDGRLGDAEDALREERAHVRVLGEVAAGGIGRRPDVEQGERAAVGDHLDRERWPVHARQALEVQDRGRDAGPAVTGGDDRVGLAVTDEAHADVDARVALAPDRDRGLLVHADRLRCGDDPDVLGQRAVDMGSDRSLVADEDEVGVGMGASPVDGPCDDLHRAVVPTHRIDRDTWAERGDGVAATAEDREVHGSALTRHRRRGALLQEPCSCGSSAGGS